MALALVLVVFFLLGYLYVGIFSNTNLLLAFILFFGSIFVSIVLTLLNHLMDTARTRSIDIAEVLVGVIDARDPNLNGHSLSVQNLTMLLYRHLPAHLRGQINPVSLEYAALMHDVGKMGVPEAILNKPGKLDADEWTVMKQHPRTGVRILKPLRTFDDVSDWIEYHHERIDGNGYYGLKGDEIPWPRGSSPSRIPTRPSRCEGPIRRQRRTRNPWKSSRLWPAHSWTRSWLTYS